MAINNYMQMQNTLKNYGVDNWAKSAELSNRLQFEEGADQVAKGDQKSFGEMLSESVSKVNDLQIQADQAMQKLASGESQNLHETLLAVEKADIAFRTMNQVRMKVIDAYKDIMKMQV